MRYVSIQQYWIAYIFESKFNNAKCSLSYESPSRNGRDSGWYPSAFINVETTAAVRKLFLLHLFPNDVYDHRGRILFRQ